MIEIIEKLVKFYAEKNEFTEMELILLQDFAMAFENRDLEIYLESLRKHDLFSFLKDR